VGSTTETYGNSTQPYVWINSSTSGSLWASPLLEGISWISPRNICTNVGFPKTIPSGALTVTSTEDPLPCVKESSTPSIPQTVWLFSESPSLPGNCLSCEGSIPEKWLSCLMEMLGKKVLKLQRRLVGKSLALSSWYIFQPVKIRIPSERESRILGEYVSHETDDR